MSEPPYSNSVGCVVSFPSCGGSLNPTEIRRESADSATTVSVSPLGTLPCCCQILTNGCQDDSQSSRKKSSSSCQNSSYSEPKHCTDPTSTIINHIKSGCTLTYSTVGQIPSDNHEVLATNSRIDNKMTISCPDNLVDYRQPMSEPSDPFVNDHIHISPSVGNLKLSSGNRNSSEFHKRNSLQDFDIDSNVIKKLMNKMINGNRNANESAISKNKMKSVQEYLSTQNIPEGFLMEKLISRSVPGNLNEDVTLLINNQFTTPIHALNRKVKDKTLESEISETIIIQQESNTYQHPELIPVKSNPKLALDCNSKNKDKLVSFTKTLTKVDSINSSESIFSSPSTSCSPNVPLPPKIVWGPNTLESNDFTAEIDIDKDPDISKHDQPEIVPTKLFDEFTDKAAVYTPPYDSNRFCLIDKSLASPTSNIKSCDTSMQQEAPEPVHEVIKEKANNKKQPIEVHDGRGTANIKISLEPCESPTIEKGKRRPPLQRGISRNKSDPKILPVHIHVEIFIFL